MFATLKAEFRKLLTVRSTYIITAFVLVAVGLLSYFVLGQQQEARSVADPDMLYDAVYTSLGMFSLFGAIIAILLITHEYRYNTIAYTFTGVNKRIKVLFAKAIVLLVYGLVAGLLVALVGYFATKLGIAAAGLELVRQELNFPSVLWQLGSYTLASVFIGLILGLLIRSIVGAIVVFFLLPVAEQLLSLLFKENTKYLPTQAIEGIVPGGQVGLGGGDPLSHVAALGVVAVYLVVFGTIAAVMFVRRDAN